MKQVNKIAILSAKDISCDYYYTLSPATAKKRFNIITNSTKHPVLAVDFFNNKYYLSDNFDNYAALRTINKNKLVRCHIIADQLDNHCQRLLRVLSKAFQEKGLPWKLRYSLIAQLNQNFNLSPRDIVEKTDIKPSELNKFLIEPDIPDRYKEIAIEKGYGIIFNAIYRCKFNSDLTTLLYDMAISTENRLTNVKLDLLKQYLNSGFTLTHHPHDLKTQIMKIVNPKEYIEAEYWKNINHEYANPLYDVSFSADLDFETTLQ